MAHFSLLNDIVFKIVFGTDQSEPVLRALLNALLELSGSERIREIVILNPYLDKENILDKGVVLDVKARDELGRQYNIEIQLQSQIAFIERSLYYLSRLYGSQLQAGQAYSELARTIGINLVDFVLFPYAQSLHSKFRLREVASGHELTDVLEAHYIELAKFKAESPADLRTPFEKWLHVLKFGEAYSTERIEVPVPLRKEEGIEMAIDSMRKAWSDDRVREMMELRKKADHDEATRREQARREGLAEGREEGREEGRRQAKLETARRLLSMGLDREQIVQATDLSEAELDALLSTGEHS